MISGDCRITGSGGHRRGTAGGQVRPCGRGRRRPGRGRRRPSAGRRRARAPRRGRRRVDVPTQAGQVEIESPAPRRSCSASESGPNAGSRASGVAAASRTVPVPSASGTAHMAAPGCAASPVSTAASPVARSSGRRAGRSASRTPVGPAVHGAQARTTVSPSPIAATSPAPGRDSATTRAPSARAAAPHGRVRRHHDGPIDDGAREHGVQAVQRDGRGHFRSRAEPGLRQGATLDRQHQGPRGHRIILAGDAVVAGLEGRGWRSAALRFSTAPSATARMNPRPRPRGGPPRPEERIVTAREFSASYRFSVLAVAPSRCSPSPGATGAAPRTSPRGRLRRLQQPHFAHRPADPRALPRRPRLATPVPRQGGALRVPVIGRIVAGAGQIPVRRGSADARLSLEPAMAAVRAGECVAVYPEGTLTRDPNLWPMVGKTGAARIALTTGVPGDPHRAVGCAGAARARTPSGCTCFRRPLVHVWAGPPVDLAPWQGRPLDATVLAQATDAILDAITRPAGADPRRDRHRRSDGTRDATDQPLTGDFRRACPRSGEAPMTRAAVMGTGSWGTTFAAVLADAGAKVTLWGRNPRSARRSTSGTEHPVPAASAAAGIRSTPRRTRPAVLDGADSSSSPSRRRPCGRTSRRGPRPSRRTPSWSA